MPSRTVICPDCGETVPSRSLSCPACGALFVSVAGGAVRSSVDAAAGAAADHVKGDDPSAMAPARIQSQALPEASPDDAPVPTPPADRGPAIPLAPSSIRQTQVEVSGSIASGLTAAMAATPAADGGYLPPGTTPSPATLPGPSVSVPAGLVQPSAAVAPSTTTSDPAGTLPTLDLAWLDYALGYAAAAGSGLIAFGMLMPWSAVVIGASGVQGLFNTWGLAGPGHVLVLLWALAVLAVSVLPNRIPVSIRSGLVGLMLGVFSLGLVWPYLIGPLGAGIGVLVVTVGALVLTATGITSAWRERHAADDRSV